MSDIHAVERGENVMDKVTESRQSDVWSVFFWGLVVCIALGAVVYLIG